MLINIDAENSIFCQKKKNLKNILYMFLSKSATWKITD